MYTPKKPYFYGTGRRKSSVARVRLIPGSGVITINERDIKKEVRLEGCKKSFSVQQALTNILLRLFWCGGKLQGCRRI